MISKIVACALLGALSSLPLATTPARAETCKSVFVVDGVVHNRNSSVEDLEALIESISSLDAKVLLYPEADAGLSLAKGAAVRIAKLAEDINDATSHSLVVLHHSAFTDVMGSDEVSKDAHFLKAIAANKPDVIIYSRADAAWIKKHIIEKVGKEWEPRIRLVTNRKNVARWGDSDGKAIAAVEGLAGEFAATCKFADLPAPTN